MRRRTPTYWRGEDGEIAQRTSQRAADASDKREERRCQAPSWPELGAGAAEPNDRTHLLVDENARQPAICPAPSAPKSLAGLVHAHVADAERDAKRRQCPNQVLLEKSTRAKRCQPPCCYFKAPAEVVQAKPVAKEGRACRPRCRGGWVMEVV